MSVKKIGYAQYRVYWESQMGDDPEDWYAAHDIPYSIENDPGYTDELWPYQSAYIITIEGSAEQIERFENEY